MTLKSQLGVLASNNCRIPVSGLTLPQTTIFNSENYIKKNLKHWRAIKITETGKKLIFEMSETQWERLLPNYSHQYQLIKFKQMAYMCSTGSSDKND